jgi:hypothetical protein
MKVPDDGNSISHKYYNDKHLYRICRGSFLGHLRLRIDGWRKAYALNFFL